jgi:mono/diheme cytochrome c family protein
MNKVLKPAGGALLILPVVVILPVAGFAAPTHDAARAMYLQYCGACHGESGKGDGVVSGFLRPRPTDLTQIAKKAGGAYSSAQVVQMIDGTKTVRAHGDADMPVWGEVFRQRSTAPMSQRVEIQGKLLLIAEYLRSIQEK